MFVGLCKGVLVNFCAYTSIPLSRCVQGIKLHEIVATVSTIKALQDALQRDALSLFLPLSLRFLVSLSSDRMQQLMYLIDTRRHVKRYQPSRKRVGHGRAAGIDVAGSGAGGSCHTAAGCLQREFLINIGIVVHV